jgi:hypothetical protein
VPAGAESFTPQATCWSVLTDLAALKLHDAEVALVSLCSLVHRQAGFDPPLGAVDVERQMAVAELGQLLEDDCRVRGAAVGIDDDLGRLVGQGGGREVGHLVRRDVDRSGEVDGLEVGRTEGVDENHRGEATDQVLGGQLAPRGPVLAHSLQRCHTSIGPVGAFNLLSPLPGAVRYRLPAYRLR